MNAANPEISSRKKSIALSVSVGGAVLGYVIGSYGGSPAEGGLWVVLLGISFFFLTISHIESSVRQRLIVIAFHGCQIGIFVVIGTLLTWTTGDVTGIPLCLKIGFLLSTLTGIVNWEAAREMPGGFFFLLGIFLGIGAGAGALVGILFQFNVGAGATLGALVALLLPYYFYQINARPVFLTFVICTFGGMQVIAAYGWSLLQGYYYTAAFTFIVALVLMAVDYLQVHAWKKSRQNSLLPYLKL